MASIPYPIGSSVDFLREGMNNNYDQKGIMELGKIGEYMSNISCRVQEMIETGLHHITPDLSNVETLRGKGEEKTRELLRDTHNTFGLFMRGLFMASSYLKAGKNTSVELYKEDVNNKEFVEGIKIATDEGKYAKGLTLDIRPEDHGSIGKKSIEKLHEVCELGVGIGIEAFPEDSDGDINIDTIRSLIQNKIKPKFIKITNNVLAKIKNNKVNKQIINLYKGLISMGIHIIKYDDGTVTKDNTDEINRKKILAKSIIDSSFIQPEPMLTYEGELWAEEFLVRFNNGLSTYNGLLQLQELGHTEDLVVKMLGAAIHAAKEGRRVSINLYIKDLSSNHLLTLIHELTEYLPSQYRKNIIFELLEERYGMIDEKFIKHVRFIQENGFSIAIDDLYVSEQNKGMSIEILDELLEAEVYPDYIKLDGKHSMAIRDGSISKSELGKIGSLIGQFAYKKPITVVAEWIQDMPHAKQIQDFFDAIKKNDTSHTMRDINIVFQGIKIKEGIFGEKYQTE